MPHLPSYLHPPWYLLCLQYIYSSAYSIYIIIFMTYKFTGSKFVQIHLFIQCEVIMKLSSYDQKLYLCFQLGKETIQKNIVVNIKMFFCR